MATTETITTEGTGTWTVPNGVTSIIVECIGAGGAGSNSGGGGGGGGGYAKGTIAVSPGTVYNIQVGQGPANTGVGSTLRSTWFSSSSIIIGNGGSHGANSTTNASGGTGSAHASVTSVTTYTGGQGGAPWRGGAASAQKGGSGGGTAGPYGAGGNGSNATSSTTFLTGGSAVNGTLLPNPDGDGGRSNGSQDGYAPGGGGGGANYLGSYGPGARGELRITYEVDPSYDPTQMFGIFY